MNDFPKALLGAAMIALAACSGGGDGAAQEPPLAGASIGGDFELTGESGETIRESDFDGDYRLIYFGYTFCPDVCPVDMLKLGQGLRALEESDPDLAARIQPIFVSVDPGRDTPEVLAEFTDNFHPRLLGATGTQEQIDRMVRDYGAYAEIENPDSSDNYLVSHMNNVTLFGPAGEPLAIIPMEGTGEEVAAEIARWAS